jgi:hypothetical protein
LIEFSIADQKVSIDIADVVMIEMSFELLIFDDVVDEIETVFAAV